MPVLYLNSILRTLGNYPAYWGLISFTVVTFCCSGCTSLEAPTDRRVITDGEFKEELAITTKTPKAQAKRSYYWFKSQDIYASQNDYAGLLLNGPYTKYYYTNELAEKGHFKKGLKIGKWTSWYKTGIISKVSKWKKGRLSGAFITRDSLGRTLVSGKYKNGKKEGYWIDHAQKDTLYYAKGFPMIIDSSFEKPGFVQRTFGFLKRNKKQPPKEGKTKKEKDTTKTGFFKRLFAKKDKENEQDVVVVKPKKLSQKQRTELVKAKQNAQLAGATANQSKKEQRKTKRLAAKKNNTLEKQNKAIVTKKKSKKQVSAPPAKQKKSVFKRWFGKKEGSNQNHGND